jgi:hypothetical protein
MHIISTYLCPSIRLSIVHNTVRKDVSTPNYANASLNGILFNFECKLVSGGSVELYTDDGVNATAVSDSPVNITVGFPFTNSSDPPQYASIVFDHPYDELREFL